MLMLLFLVEGTSVHGSELLSLPSDFLCCKCAIEFRQSTVAELESDADAWKQKLQLRAGTSTTAVLEEREALRVRDFLLRVAQTDEATGDSHEAFCELISKKHKLLSKSRCDAVLNKSTKHSLGPFHYWHEPLAKYCQAMANCFGLVWEESKLCTGRLRCPALQRDSSEPARWSDYTGRPGLVVEEVWKWRLWAMARGGVQALRRPEQLALEGAEASADPSFIRVTRPDGVSLFALDAKPQGLFPSEFVWRQVLDLASSHDGVRALEVKRKAGETDHQYRLRVRKAELAHKADVASVRASKVAAWCRRAEEERLRWGIVWDRVQYKVDPSVALREARSTGMLSSEELSILRDCEAFASANDGAFPQEIMLEAGENDRHDHVRRREADLARKAHLVAVRIAQVMLYHWQTRRSVDWCKITDGQVQSVRHGTSLDVDQAETESDGLCDSEIELDGVSDGFGLIACAAAKLKVPDDGLSSDGEEGDVEDEEPEVVENPKLRSQDPGHLFGRGSSRMHEIGSSIDECPLGEGSLGRDASLVRTALKRVLEDLEATSDGCEALSADHLVEKVGESLGPYSNRMRVLRPLVAREVQKHFALAGADRVVLEQGGRVVLGNAELRSVVRTVLRRQDLRHPFTVRQCREAIVESHGMVGDLSSIECFEFSGLVMQEWMCLWETAWRDFLQDTPGSDDVPIVDAARCSARIRTKGSTIAVLQQCRALAEDGSAFCRFHQNKRLHGVWDPLNPLSDMDAKKQESVIAESKRRAMDHGSPLPAETGFNVPRHRRQRNSPSDGDGQSASFAMKRTPVPEFVAHVPGEARVFAEDPEALPPFPCLLCADTDFGSEDALRRHVAEKHVSWVEYRKCLLYRASRGRIPVMSQVWRLVMGHAAEELATGSKIWDDDHVISLKDQATRAGVLQHMAPLVQEKGGLPKFLKFLSQVLERQKIQPADSVEKALQLVCEADASVRACFQCRGLSPYMEAAQHSVLQVARDGRASGRPVSEFNALESVKQAYVGILSQQGSSSRDDCADWSFSGQQSEDGDGNCVSEYWRFASTQVAERAKCLRHLLRPVSERGGLGHFLRELRRDMDELASADKSGSLRDSATAEDWIECLSTGASTRCTPRDTGLGPMSMPSCFWELELSEERRRWFADVLWPFYRRWFADVVSCPLEKVVVVEVVKMAMHGRAAFEKPEEDLMAELSVALGHMAESGPTEAELWDWASFGTAAQVAASMTVGEDAFGPPDASRRETFRHMKECCVCARGKWSSELDDVFFFEAPECCPGEQALFPREVDEQRAATGRSLADVRRIEARKLFSPYAYFRRWSFALPGGEGLGGIPLAELQASCVRDPVTGELWLLHKKAFKLCADGVTADPKQKVSICKHCRESLARTQPALPKFALANDLWIGRVPDALRDLSEGAALLLPLARAMIKRYNCKTEGTRWRSDGLLVKAFTGNVCVVPQASSGALHLQAPVSEAALQESLLLAFTGLEEELEKGFHKELGVPIPVFRRALEYQRRCNKAYAERHWDEEHGFARLSNDGQPLGLPSLFASCLRRQVARVGEEDRVRQHGPADALYGRGGAADDIRHLSSSHALGEQSPAPEETYEQRVSRLVGVLSDLRVWMEEHGDVLPRGIANGPRVGSDAAEHELVIQRQYRDAIARGLKTVEARVCKGVAATVDTGDVLKFGHVRCLVKERREFKEQPCNVRAMLESVGVEPLLPGCTSVSEGVRVYHAIGDFEEGARAEGVVAFFLELLPPRGDSPSPQEAELAVRVRDLVQELDRASNDLPEDLRELARDLLLDRDQERDEWVACVADDDSQVDGHRQYARVTENLRRAFQRFSQNRRHEASVNGDSHEDEGSRGDYRCAGGREGVKAAIQKLKESARSINEERVRRDMVVAHAKAEGAEPQPGLEAKAAASMRHTGKGRPCWVVPTAGKPLSMFDASFWTSVCPLRFPYGDGVFGLQRQVPLSYDEWVRYLLERVELEYHCDVPWWDCEPEQVPDCVPAARDAKTRGNALYRSGDFAGAVRQYNVALHIDPTSVVLLSNRSAVFGKLGHVARARADADTCVFRCPSWWKGHLRRGEAMLQQGLWDEAVLAYAMAHRLNPHGPETRAALCRLLTTKRGPQELRPQMFSQDALSADSVCALVERARSKVETSERSLREAHRLAAQKRVQELPQDWRAALQLARAELACVVNLRGAAALEHMDVATETFATALDLAAKQGAKCCACVLQTEARVMRLLEERIGELQRRDSLLLWLQRETRTESGQQVSDHSESKADSVWNNLDIAPTGDTPQGWEPHVEEIHMDEDPRGHEVSGVCGDARALDELNTDVGSSPSPRKQPPRWRRDRDLLTMLYCLWRRRRYIQSARLFADKTRWQETLRELGEVTAQEFLDAMELCGKGASMAQVLQNNDVSRRVKQALRTLDMCMNEVLGTNAHRTALRHKGFGYRLLWGAPLVFTTPNVADTKHAMVKLLYEGAEVASWKLLEEDDPDLGQKEDMLRRVSEDPFAQAVFSDMMIRLYLEHFVGVSLDPRQGFADGAAARLMTPGLFGIVQAFFGPVETQGRGGLHAHISVWVKNAMGSWIVDQLRLGKLTAVQKEDMELRLRNWREAVLAAVRTMSFCSVEEFARQLGLEPADLDPLPLSAERQAATYMDGKVETSDVQVLRAPLQAFPSKEQEAERVRVPWRDDPPCGPARKRPYARVQAQEPLKPNPCSQQPRWRRLPRFVVDSANGQARVAGVAANKKAESRVFRKVFAFDARRNFCKSHIHRCMPTCYQHRGGGKPGDHVRVCRFEYYHSREVAAFPRRWEKKLRRCRNPDCPRLKQGDKVWVVNPSSGRLKFVNAHPWHCAVPAAVPGDKDVRKYFRKGKDLVLPPEDSGPGAPGGHPVQDVFGHFVTTASGKSVCVAYNNDSCREECDHGSEHVCRVCLGPHMAIDCDRRNQKCRVDVESVRPSEGSSQGGLMRHPVIDHLGRFVTNYDGIPVCLPFNRAGCEARCSLGCQHVCHWCLGDHQSSECLRWREEHPRRDPSGRALTSFDGKLVCLAYNLGRCPDPCRHGREHFCWHCLGRHRFRDCHRFLPGVDCSEAKVGSPSLLRYHPDCSKSHPAAQSFFRCNLDVQNTDRVHVLILKRRRRRWRRVCEASKSVEQDVDPAVSLNADVPDGSLHATAGCVGNSGDEHVTTAATVSGTSLDVVANEARNLPAAPESKFPSDVMLLQSYLISRGKECDAPDDATIRRAIVRDTRMSSLDVLDSLLRAVTSAGSGEGLCPPGILTELSALWSTARGKRKGEDFSEATGTEQDLLGSGRPSSLSGVDLSAAERNELQESSSGLQAVDAHSDSASAVSVSAFADGAVDTSMIDVSGRVPSPGRVGCSDTPDHLVSSQILTCSEEGHEGLVVGVSPAADASLSSLSFAELPPDFEDFANCHEDDQPRGVFVDGMLASSQHELLSDELPSEFLMSPPDIEDLGGAAQQHPEDFDGTASYMEEFLPPVDDLFVFRGSQSTHVEATQDVPYISEDSNWIGDDADDIEHVDWIGVEMPDELASEGSGSCDNAGDRPRKRVRYEVTEEEHEVLVGPEREALYASVLTADDRIDGIVLALTRLMQDMSNLAYYTTKYSTKDNPQVSDVLPEQAIGVERLRESEEEVRTHPRSAVEWSDFLLEAGRKTLIRLQTAANRASVKKLSEMVFQMYFGHECYMSHDTWTIYCKRLVKHGFRAAKRREMLGPDRSWLEVGRSERDLIIAQEGGVDPDFASVEPDQAGGLDLAAPERSGLRVAKGKKTAPVSSRRSQETTGARSAEGKTVLSLLLRSRKDMCPDVPDPSDDVREDISEALDADEALPLIREGSHEDDAASVEDILRASDDDRSGLGAVDADAIESDSCEDGASDDMPRGRGKRGASGRTPEACSDSSVSCAEASPGDQEVKKQRNSATGEGAEFLSPPVRRSARLSKKREEGLLAPPASDVLVPSKKRRNAIPKQDSEREMDGAGMGRGRGRGRGRRSAARVRFSLAVGQEPVDASCSDADQRSCEPSLDDPGSLGRFPSRGRGGRSCVQPRRSGEAGTSASSGREGPASAAPAANDVSSLSLPAGSETGSRRISERIWKGGRHSARARLAEDRRQHAQADRPNVGSAGVMALGGQKSHDYDWLHRGTREPLASMGILHYGMFVYSVHAPRGAAAAPPDDFSTFRFADTHDDCAVRVQKLRVDEMFRVPRLCGFTMPRFDGSEVDKFRNALFKSVLLRPVHMPRDPDPIDGERAAPDLDLVAPYLGMVNSMGDFVEPWLAWLAQQRCMAERYRALEAKVGKMFTIADIDCSVGYMEHPDLHPFLHEQGRLQPSAAEFMANITIEVATNLDLGAEARAGRRVGARPDADMFLSERTAFGAECGPDGEDDFGQEGGDDDGQPGERGIVGKLYESRLPVSASDLLRVACCEEHVPAPVMAEYLKSFKSGMGAVQRAGAVEVPENAPTVAWSDRLHSQMRAHGGCFQMYRERQKQLFQAWRQAAQGGDVQAPEVHGVRRNVSLKPSPAHMGELVTPETFLKEAMREASKPPKNLHFNKEQKDFLALITVKVQEMIDAGYLKGAQAGQPDMTAEVPSLRPMRIFLGGPGGAGKSECIDIAGRMIEHFFGAGSKRTLAASNSAARGVRGDTVHTGLYLGAQCSFRLGCKALKSPPQLACQESWAPVKALFLEEVSMISPCMLAGISYRLCRARKGLRPWLDETLYEDKEHMFGGIPIIVMLGDFMQLGAMERGLQRVSLIMQPRPSWYDECFAGRRIFWNGLTHVVMLCKTHRFKDDIMPAFLAYMRKPDGRPMPKNLRRVLAEWEVLDVKPSAGARDKVQEWRDRCALGDPVLDENGVTVGRRPWHAYEMGIAWLSVQRLMHYRAVRDAREEKQLLLYAQAVETCTSQPLSLPEYRRALQVVNMNTTGKLLGYCPLFKGMRVRLTAKLSGKFNIVHDAVGTIVEIWLHERDKQAERAWEDPEHEVRHKGIAQLRALPLGVVVEFADVQEDLVGLGKGRILVEPHVSYWKYKTHENLTGKRKQAEVSMARRQVPLAPEPIRTVQTAQGMSMDAAMLFMGKPGNMDADDYWMHLYVMISRVRRSAGLLAFDVPALSVFERGPPAWVVEGIEKLEAKAFDSLADIRRARVKLGEGFDPDEPCSEGSVSANRSRPTDVSAAPDSRTHVGEIFADAGLPDHVGDVDAMLSGFASLGALLAEPRKGLGSFPSGTFRRCPDVTVTSGLDLLREASASQLEQLGLSDPLANVAMTTQPCSGFANPGNDVCFLTAPLQIFLRLDPVAGALRRHAQFHASEIRDGTSQHGKCLACDLWLVAEALRSGRVPDVSAVVSAAQSGLLGKEVVENAKVQGRLAPGDALSLLFGSVPDNGVVKYPGLVDSLVDLLGSSEATALQRSRKSRKSAIPHSGKTTATLFRDILFGAVVRERAYCSACRKATDVLKDRCYITLKVGAHASATPVRLEDLLEAWGSVGGSGPKCARGCKNSRCSVAQMLEREPPVLAIVLNRLEKGKKRRSPVSFPEELVGLRSGRYALASVLLHLGDGSKDGHFVSICSQGPGTYVECNDLDQSNLTWDQVAVAKTWRDAYVLIYVRRLAMVSAPVRQPGSVPVRNPQTPAPDAEGTSLPCFPQMSAEDSAHARQLKAAAAERRREEARMRGIGDLRGDRKTSTTQLARDAVAAIQRRRSAQVSRARVLQDLRQQYGAKNVNAFLLEVGEADVDLTVLEGVLAADQAHVLEGEIDQELARNAGQFPGSTRWQSVLNYMSDVLREGLLVVLRAEYKGRCTAILSSEWSSNWVGWDSRRPDAPPDPHDGDGLYQVLEFYRQHDEEGDLATPVMLAVHDVVRRHIRLAHSHSAVTHLTDKQKVAALLRQGLKVGKGNVWGANNCLADSLLQLMQENKIIAPCPEMERKAPCAALRESLIRLPENSPLRPRRRDAVNSIDRGLDDGAFLQSNVHGDYILKFFLEYFGERRMVLRQLPSAGVRISICSRFDSDVIPGEYTDVCQAVIVDVDDQPLDFRLFNRTGDGVSGYHYDPIRVMNSESASSSSRCPPGSLRQASHSGELRRSKRKSGA